jgi:2-dehydropantoate 2-reductase
LIRPDPPPFNPKFLVFGAGAIGTYLGVSLALSSYPVVFLVRPEAARALESRGLRLLLDDQERRIQDPQIAVSIDQALVEGPYQAAIFALKSFDTETALKDLAPFAKELPIFLCLQNGVENEGFLAENLGSEKVIAGTVTSSVGRRGPGDAVLERLRGVGLAGDHPLSTSLVEAFNSAGLKARLYRNPAGMKWSKLLTNLLANASSAILDMTPAQVFAHPGLYRLEIEQLREAQRVMEAQRIPVIDLPGTPVRLLALAARALPPLLSQPFLRKAVAGGRGGKMPSFHIDLHSGRGRSEVEYLNGAVVRAAARSGIATPINQILTELLLALTRGDLPLDTFTHRPERLLQEVGKRGSTHP